MGRSKLEMRVDILRALAYHGSLKLTHIMNRTNINCDLLKQHLTFLTRFNLVHEQRLPKTRVTYTITARGLTVLDYVQKLNKIFLLTEDAQTMSL